MHISIYLHIYIYGFPDSSVGKVSTCNAGDPDSNPGWGRCAGEGIGYLLQYSWASLVAQLVKNLPAVPGDLDLIPGLGRSRGEGNSYPLQYSGLENSTDCIGHILYSSYSPFLLNFRILFLCFTHP